MAEKTPAIGIADIPEDVRENLRSEILQLKQADNSFSKEAASEYAKAWLDGFSNPSLAGTFADGLMLGFADEAKGAAKATASYLFGDGSKSRITETARARGQIAGSRWSRPKLSMAAGLAGSVAPAMAGGAGLLAAAGRGAAREAPGILARIARGAGAGAAGGAAGGAAYGAGSAVGNLDDRATGAAEGAVTGAALGAVGGAAAVPLAQGAQYVWRRGAAALSGRGATAAADRNLSRALEEAGITADDVADRVGAARAEGVPMIAADAMDDPGGDLLEYALNTPGRGRADAKALLTARQRGQAGRLDAATARITGVDEGAASARLAAKDASRAETGPAYDALNSIATPQRPRTMLARMMEHPAWRSAYEDAAEDSALRASTGELPRQMPSLEDFRNGADLSARETDLILQGVQRQVKSRQAGGILPGSKADTGGPRGSHGLNRTAEMIRDAMADEVPEFATARAAAKAGLDFDDGAKLGEKLFAKGKTVDELTAVWNRASPEKRRGIRQGLVAKLRADLGSFTSGPAADASRMVNGPSGIKAKLRVVLGDRQAEQLLRQFEMEGRLSGTAALPFNSATARRGATAAEVESEPISAAIPTSAEGLLARVLGKLDQNTARRMRGELSRIGLLDDPAEIRRELTRAQGRLPQLVAPSRVGIGVGVPIGPMQHQMQER